MTEIVFHATLFDLPLLRRVPIPLKRQVEVSAEGMSILLDLLLGLDYKTTFIYSDSFKNNYQYLLDKASSEGHKVISKADWDNLKISSQKRFQVFGIDLSGTAIQHIPNDLYRFLVKLGRRRNLVIELSIWSFSSALHESVYKVPDKYSQNCGNKLVLRLSNVIFDIKKELQSNPR